GQDQRVRDIVQRVNEFLCSFPDPKDWRQRVLSRYGALDGRKLTGDWSKVRSEMLVRALQDLQVLAERAAVDLRARPARTNVREAVEDLSGQFVKWCRQANPGASAAELDRLCAEIQDYAAAAAPRKSKSTSRLPPAELAAFEHGQETIRSL